ncbi:UDP-N-acetylmuramate--L-alanine ligase [Pollutibacter soli]|uniref:UDP-N-acetylmuramate--L-alanine ligase n=1 Tax=Pollutibacter soli TaxID=3034157 RepID=UPI003013A5D0
MSRLNDIRHIYFIGIGGIGMSAIARYFHANGAKVSGYDRTSTVLTRELESEGMEIVYHDDPTTVKGMIDAVVYTPAIPKDNKVMQHFRINGFSLLKRSDILQLISEASFNICIAGTHGKTTISTMTAHLLRDSGYGCNAFLGGISVNYNTNFWSSTNNVCVIEADEYDRSFLKLSPDIEVISAMDADHLDIYGTAAEMEKAFIAFSARLKPGGVLLSRYGLKRTAELEAPVHFTYGVNEEKANVFAENIKISDGSYVFDVFHDQWKLNGVQLNMGGMHNVENSIAAIAIAHRLGIADDKIKSAVASFRGVKRRFEYIVKNNRQVYIDDYAHHPEELRALISSAKNLFPGKKCTVIFQPHLFTRTRDLVDGFAESLSIADEIILLPIYPARELPIPGVTSEMIREKIKDKSVIILEKGRITEWVAGRKPEFLITAGAGDIDTLVKPLGEILS